MVLNRPLIFVEDDKEEQEIHSDLFKNFNYPFKIIFKNNAEEPFEYLKSLTIILRIIINKISMVG